MTAARGGVPAPGPASPLDPSRSAGSAGSASTAESARLASTAGSAAPAGARRTPSTPAADALRRLRPDGQHAADLLADAGARVAWSVAAEPGDAVVGAVLECVPAALALRAVDRALGGGTADLLDLCVESGVVTPDDVVAFSRALDAAVERWRPRLDALDIGRVLDAAVRVGSRLVLPGDAEWPARFDDLGRHAPVVLWARGPEVPGVGPALADDGPALAVVGSRANTVAGAETAAEITSRAVDAGCAIVSGGAYGIDAVAHRVAIAAGNRSVALLAGGVDQLYPAGNTDMLRAVMRHGTVYAETPPGTRPSRWRFLARNRLIAAAADAVVVVEAGARSGALNTAHHAAELGRPVLAVPGALRSAASVGCHRLIASGRAGIVVSPDDPAAAARAAVSGGSTDPTPPLSGAVEDPDVLRVVDALTRRRAIPTQEAARRSGLSVADATDALALAELQGLVRKDSGGWSRAG